MVHIVKKVGIEFRVYPLRKFLGIGDRRLTLSITFASNLSVLLPFLKGDYRNGTCT